MKTYSEVKTGAIHKMNRGALCAATVLLGVLLPVISFCAETDTLTFPMNVLQDEGSFTFYVNEEVLVREHFEWREDGSFISDYEPSMAGQTVRTTMEIQVDEKGLWTKISMETPRRPVRIVKGADKQSCPPTMC